MILTIYFISTNIDKIWAVILIILFLDLKTRFICYLNDQITATHYFMSIIDMWIKGISIVRVKGGILQVPYFKQYSTSRFLLITKNIHFQGRPLICLQLAIIGPEFIFRQFLAKITFNSTFDFFAKSHFKQLITRYLTALVLRPYIYGLFS